MFSLNFEKKIKRWLSILVVFTILLPKVGLAVSLGSSLSFAHSSAPPLNNSMHLSEGIHSYNYVSSVGGVAFGGTAIGIKGYDIIDLSYQSGSADGHRLQVTLKDATGKEKKIPADIFDWQLIPIANFADKDQHACFTLFGKLDDKDEEKRRLSRNERILNYHPAFFNI